MRLFFYICYNQMEDNVINYERASYSGGKGI